MNGPWLAKHVDDNLQKKIFQHFKGDGVGYIQSQTSDFVCKLALYTCITRKVRRSEYNRIGYSDTYTKVGPEKYFLPSRIAEDASTIWNFKPRSTDIWIVTFPRSGTTWTQEMIWLLANDLDFAKASEISLLERFPFLEFGSCISKKMYREFVENARSQEVRKFIEEACAPIYSQLDNMKERRFIKSHLPLSLLPPSLLTCGAKVIYVARNPKDVAVSYYNFHQFIKTLEYVGDFETFWNYFEKNLLLWTPYWSHVKEGWKSRFNPNVLFLFYEDIKKDLSGSIMKMSGFLGKKYDENDVKNLIDHLNFENFKRNPSVNMEILRDYGFLLDNDQKCMRNGKIGNWNEYFDDELNARADRWIKENLIDTDMRFPTAT